MRKTIKCPTTGEKEKEVAIPTNEAASAGKGEVSAGERAAAAQSEKNVATETANHDFSAREWAAIAKFQAADRPLRLKITEEWEITPDHPNYSVGWALVMEALGTTNHDFAVGLVDQLAAVTEWEGRIDERERKLNFLFSMVISEKPRNERQAMIAVQMAIIQSATMRAGQRLAKEEVARRLGENAEERHLLHSEKVVALSTAERALSKLACTYVTLSDALTRSQTGGDQKVTRQTVLVSEGGQAIVGNIMRPERQVSSDIGSRQKSPRALTHSQEVPMPMVEKPARAAMPLEHKAAKRNGKTRP